MAEEVQTAPVTAQHVPDPLQFSEERVPGSFRIGTPGKDGNQAFWYCCPCGCGVIAILSIGKSFKPPQGPSWEWDGSFDAPTFTPSIWRPRHWHGWLRNGVWESC